MTRRRFVFLLLVFLAPAALFAHGGHKHVMGTVLSVTSNKLVVKTANGEVAVPISTTTRFYRGTSTRKPARLAEVRNGMRVVAHLDGSGNAAEVHIPQVK